MATILDNDVQLDGQNVRFTLEQLWQTMELCKDQAGSLATGLDHFLKVTLSYAPGLFHCYDIKSLPRTNNDLEQLFGSWRHHQRRCTGRKVAPASLVVRGSVQIVAAIATQLHSFSASELATVSIEAWQSVRADLNRLQYKRNQQRQFRSFPATYLANLEQKFLQLALPP
ncbi:Mobile element protein [uncultured Leptolyngbya sp.]|uniref:Mobile element protein n=1 Tax=uncultured Leptolyngbya sp. TaxID=332963 RepID=A0A6J4P619_9CYAN|nr:Mobile element protein [uncultured Leptolyngbya sp.]